MTDSPAPPPRTAPHTARWGFFVVAAALGAALLVSSITSYMGAQTLLLTVIRGQAQALYRDLSQQLEQGQHHRGPPDAAELERFVEEHVDDGVRRVVVSGPRGEPMAAAGEGPELLPLRPEQLLVRGDLVQAAFVLAMPRDDGPPPWRRPGLREREGKGPPPREGKAPLGLREGKAPLGPGQAGALDDGPPPGFRPPPPVVSLEFVPEAALALRARALRDLGVGITVAVALMLGAGIFWRLSVRAQAAEGRLATQRHLAALGEMSAVLAHEIRNPLASLKGHVQLLAERVEGQPALERKTKRIVDETLRLETLTKGLLDFARTGSIEPISFEPAALLRARAEASRGEVKVDDEAAPAKWRADRAKLEQVLDNLLDNAHQAAPEQVVEARVRSEGGRLVFEVRDHGPGVPAGEREQIFEPFHTTRTRGTGLGLAVSRRIVEQHGGTIEVYDAEGGGACFRVTLPAGVEAAGD